MRAGWHRRIETTRHPAPVTDQLPPPSAIAFAPGRVNLIGEHTDYNDGLSLPFAIAEGVTVTAAPAGAFEAHARDYRESDRFDLPAAGAAGWRAFVRGTVSELVRSGIELPPTRIEIEGTVAQGAGLASSAALEVALALALSAIAGAEPPPHAALARLCARVERDWVGAQTGLLDQLAALHGVPGHALRIDFRDGSVDPVPIALDGWRIAVLHSGEPRALAASGYNERRSECEQARKLLCLASLRDARRELVARLPPPLGVRVRHVIDENERVDAAVGALRAGDLPRVAALLDASHASLRDLYAASTAAVERTVERLRREGAAGARMVGGGFGGHVLALFPPDVEVPRDAAVVEPSGGARLVAR